MSKLLFPSDNGGDSRNLRLLVLSDQRTGQQARPYASTKGFTTHVRPLTVAEVLPPHLRSGSFAGEAPQFYVWPLHGLTTANATGGPEQYSPSTASVEPDQTPRYRPGRYPYSMGGELSSSDKMPQQKPIYRDGYGFELPETPAAARGVLRNIDNDFREAHTQKQNMSEGTFYGEPQEHSKSTQSKPVKAWPHFLPESSMNSITAPEDYTMFQGEAHSSSSTWLGTSNTGRRDMESPHGHSATVLTSTLVARMEALKQQLLRVSSTLTNVQERAASLASSMGHRSQVLMYSDGGAAAAQAVGPAAPAARAAAAAPPLDLSRQRYYPPVGFTDFAPQDCSTSPYSPGGSNGGETRLYVVSVSTATGAAEPRQSPVQESAGAVDERGFPASFPRTMSALAAAAAAAAAAGPFSGPISDRYSPASSGGDGGVGGGPSGLAPASLPRPQRSSPAVAVQLGALEGSPYHPFELGSPASRTVHVAAPEPELAGSGRGGSAYCGLADKHAADAGVTDVMATPYSARWHDRRDGTACEGRDNGTGGKVYAYPRDSRDDNVDADTDDTDDDSSSGAPVGMSIAAAAAAARGAITRDYCSAAPSTTLRPSATAATAAAAGSVAPHTMSSAFARQLNLPVLQELLNGSPQPRTQKPRDPIHSPSYQMQPSAPTAAADAAAVIPSPSSLEYARHRRLSAGTYSNASSLDAERVHPWSGGGGFSGGGASYELPVTPPSGPSYQSSGGGGGSVGSTDVARPREGGRSSLGGASDVSSLDAARVHPWSGGSDLLAYNLRSADGSLELMAASPPSPPPVVEHAVGVKPDSGGRGDGARRTSISGRSLGDGSWLVLSPTVMVKVGSGRDAALLPLEDAAMVAMAAQAVIASVGVAETAAEATRQSTNAVVKQDEQDQQQDGATHLVGYGRATDPSLRHGGGDGEEEAEAEPSVAVSPVSPAPRTPYDADGDAGSGSGSTTPTPRADLSFAFHSASFALRAASGDGDGGDGDGDCDGKDWLHRADVYGDGGGSSGGVHAFVGSRGRLEDANAAATPDDDDDDDEVLKTPTHDTSSWSRLKGRYPGAGDGAAISDGDSDAGSGGGGRRRRWPLSRSAASSSSHGPGVSNSGGYSREGLYDGYSEEDEVEEHNAARRRGEVINQPAASTPPSSSSVAAAAARAAASELYHNFSFPPPEAAERVTAAAAAAAAASLSRKASPFNTATTCGTGGGGTASARSSTSGCGSWADSPGVGYSNNPLGACDGTPETPDEGSGGGAAKGQHRLARPSRIVVPSSPRSSLGGWSLPSPVPSPYAYGGVGVRTPSSGGRATGFSLRKHLDLTVSSCLFAETSSEEGDGDERDYRSQRVVSQLVGRYDPSPLPRLRQWGQRDRRLVDEESEVEEGEEVTSRLTAFGRGDSDEGGSRQEPAEEEAQEVEEEEEIMVASDDDDDATAAVAAWAYGDARKAAEAQREGICGGGDDEGEGDEGRRRSGF